MARERYADAAAAGREAWARAVALADELKPRDWQVLGACIVLTSLWSRTSDRTSVGQIQVLAGVSRGRTSESLNRLAYLGVIGWTPTRSPTRASVLTLSP